MKDNSIYNGYPDNFIDSCIKRFFDKLNITKKVYDNVEKKQLLILLPLVGRCQKTITNLNKNYLPACTLRTAFQSKTRLSSLYNFEYSIHKHLCSHIVYKFLCSSCNVTYYGQTERHRFVRFSQYLGLTALTGKNIKIPKKIGN